MTTTAIYTRASSREQQQEGFSLGAQSKLMADYAGWNALQIVKRFEDVETAKTSGRTQFTDTSGKEGRYHEADRMAQLPPNVSHTAAILRGIGNDDAGASAALFASDDPWKYAKAVTADKRQAQDTIAALFVGSSETTNIAAS
ncbi:MAG: site-specific recombinase [Acidobacteriaceae bacterium]|jgi:hypothetical protein|nr:site-specific recombinase [Acidobacteriaceae bacterium]